MTYERLIAEPEHFLFKCVSGSKAYNLDGPLSDTDYKGVFILPRKELYGLQYTPQVSNHTNDETFFEIGRLAELLQKNNPGALELLATPEQHMLFRHSVMSLVNPYAFLSKLCRDTFAGYAKTQMNKARGLNKKMNIPAFPQRKSVIDFCWVYYKERSQPLTEWLIQHSVGQQDCGLATVSHFRDCYKFFAKGFVPQGLTLNGIVRTEESNDVQISNIPKDIASVGILYFNKDGYSMHCREYREYQDWLVKRNEQRYLTNVSHGHQYDTKNMMHTFRLLSMAEEIARFKEIRVHRTDRDFLLQIKAGKYSFADLTNMVAEKLSLIEELYEKADLPDTPDPQLAETIVVSIRERIYR